NRSHHACNVAPGYSHVEHRHIPVPGEEPGKAFLKYDLVGARHIGIPCGCNPRKIVPFMCFKMLQQLLRRDREIEVKQGIEVLKNLFICGKKILEAPSLVLPLQELACPP